MKRYAIWNKKDNILTPVGEVLTAEQWINRYPVAGLESVVVVCAAGEINGSLFATLNSMVNNFEKEGCDFSKCTTPEEKLQAIEDFEDARQASAVKKRAEVEAQKEMDSVSLASIAASMEYQNMLTLEDAEGTTTEEVTE